MNNNPNTPIAKAAGALRVVVVIASLVGFYTARRGRKYAKGPRQARLGNLSDTELPLYGP